MSRRTIVGDEGPLVSVGMPVRNCQDTLKPAIRSLLAQTYQEWELLLIDDGSEDDTLKIAQQFKDPRIRAFSDGERLGLPIRLNQALTMSHGKYFARMDGDDVAYPRRLERQVGYLEQHPNVDLVGTCVIVFGSAGAPLGKRTTPETHFAICAKPFAGFPIAHPTYVGHLAWFRRYGYREKAIRCEDQDLLLRSYRFSQFANIPEILLGYREEEIHLKKTLKGRLSFTKVLIEAFRSQRLPALAVYGTVEQALKAIVDCLAVSSGLNHRLLRHRAQSITETERSDWEHVWQMVNRIEV